MKERELAIWKIGQNGYPCKINVSDSQLVCEDKSALESGLEQLLSGPIIGEKLFKIINLEILEKENGILEDSHDDENI